MKIQIVDVNSNVGRFPTVAIFALLLIIKELLLAPSSVYFSIGETTSVYQCCAKAKYIL